MTERHSDGSQLQSPQVHAEGVVFAVHDHDARRAEVFGSWNHWREPLPAFQFESGAWRTAAMALAYQNWKDDPQQAAFARRCLQAGKEVYEFGRAKEGVQQGNSYKAPYRYEECSWADDMEWGAAELFRATRNSQYLEDAKRYAGLAAAVSWMGRVQAP